MRYTKTFKEKMVRKLLGPTAMSALRLSQESGVSASALCQWKKRAKTDGMVKRSTISAKRWAAEEKLRVVLAAAEVGESGRGELLRREGLHDVDLKRFHRELAAEPGPPKEAKRTAEDKRTIQLLKKQLHRKDRALAEATALVVLSKKLNAYVCHEHRERELPVNYTPDGGRSPGIGLQGQVSNRLKLRW